MDDDINALELDSYDSDDDEWTRNFEALVHAREERTDTKRRRMESPRQQEEPSMQWTPNVPTSRVDHIANGECGVTRWMGFLDQRVKCIKKWDVLYPKILKEVTRDS